MGKQWKQCQTFIFLGSKIIADGDCRHEIRKYLLLGRKVMTNLDSIFRSRDITLPTKVRLVKAMFFPVVMYGCESWTVKKAECWRIDAFELWSWRRLLRVPWIARRSNQSILKEISPGISLEGLMLKLKLQYFGHLMQRVDSLEDSDAGRDWGQEEKGMTEDEMTGWHHWLDGRESEWTPGVGDGQGDLACCDSWGRKESDMTEQLIWSDLKVLLPGKIRNSQSLTTWPWTSWGSSFCLLPWLKIKLQIQLYNLQNYKIAKCLTLQVLHTKGRHWSERDVTLRPGMGILGQT